jgi:hypothetical protein
MLAAVVALVAVVVGLILVTRSGEDKDPTPSASASASTAAGGSGSVASASSSSPPSTVAPPSAAEPVSGNDLPPSMASVALDKPATGDTGVTARLTAINAIQGTGSGPGNVNGPALRITVSLTNGASQALSLDGVQVTMTYGAEQTPASPLNDPSQAKFGGVLEPGASAVGRYVFSVPEDARDVVTVTVGYAAGAPFLVFTGSAN